MPYICMSSAQIVGFIVLLCVACTMIALCGFLKKKISLNKINQTVKIATSMNLDAETDSAQVEGVSLLAKRKYIVGNQNKVKPITYTLIDVQKAVILINDVKAILKNGDTIEFKEGDTVSSVDNNVMLSF